MQVEFGLPDLESRAQIFQIHTRTMNCERDIRFELLARLCPNSTGADIRSVCTEAGMFAIRARRKTVTEKDFLESVNKVCAPYMTATLGVHVTWCVHCMQCHRTSFTSGVYVQQRCSFRTYMSAAGHQGLPKVQCDPQIHGVQLIANMLYVCWRICTKLLRCN